MLIIRFVVYFQLNKSGIAPLWASDGGLYGYYAKEILAGNITTFKQDYVPAYLLVFCVKFLSISLDKAIYFLPAFLSSLCVIPILLIGYIYKIVRFTFWVSIFGSITYAYYTRSFLGYYDTDSLNIFFSYMIVAFLIAFVEKKDYKYLFYSICFAILFLLWYHSSKVIVFSLFINFILYILIDKKRYYLILGLILFFTFFYFFDMDFFKRVGDYLFKKDNIQFLSHNGNKLFFKSTLLTISEAKPLYINKLGKYLSLNNFFLSLSLIFLILFYKVKKSFFLTLPILFLTILSIKSGIRFAEYGTYLVAFGLVYFLFIIKNINKFLFIVGLIIVFSIYLNIIIEKNKRLHPIFSYNSTKILKSFDKCLTKKDFILTWWDYGWPLWYYTKANTLIDNAKHFEDNYIISKLLFSSPNQTYILSKYLMQKCKTRRCNLCKIIYKNKTPKEFERSVRDINLTNKSIYFFFHKRMIKISKVMLSFSNRDLQSGKKLKKGILKLYRYPHYKNKKTSLHKIIYKNKYVILCDDKIYNSFFIQVFLLKKYDKQKFQLIDSNSEIEIFKVKQ